MSTKMKRFLSVALVLALVFSFIPNTAFAEVEVALPTATVTEIDNANLTFAMNFKVDEITQEQMEYYGNWYADFELTANKAVTFNANGGADGYLSGQYDEWSENWVNVPFEDVTLEANQPLKIMAYAAELMGEPGLKYKYSEVYETVKDFDCGVFFTDEYLYANPDLVVTLELRMYNPADESENYKIGETYVFTAKRALLPTATVTEIEKEDLTFALNFKANEVTEKQLAIFGNWYADFELTVNKEVTFNADEDSPNRDGCLSGQYDEWSENWVYVPFEDVTLGANETLKIMAYAAELLGQPGLKYTFKEVYESVKDFDCGVFFTDEFMAANPDLKVTLELRMYNPADETENYVIGDTYVFTLKKAMLPTATVTEIEKEDLTFALNFKADPATDKQLEVFGNWYADFELMVNKDTTFNANGGANGYLSGQYDAWSSGWVNVPPESVTLKANKPLKIMAYAAELLGQSGLHLTYNDVYNFVKDFDCGVYFEPEFLMANPDLEVTLALRMYNPAEEAENYTIGRTYVFNLGDIVAINVETGRLYNDVQEGLIEAKENETVALLKDVTTTMVTVPENVTFDLNRYALTTGYFSCFGNTVDNSDANTGLLIVPETRILMQKNNVQLPIKNGTGYQFFEVTDLKMAFTSEGKFAFQPFIETSAHDLLKQGAAVTGATINARVSWTKGDTKPSQDFEYIDTFVSGYLNSYQPATGKYSKMFTLLLTNAENYDLTYSVAVKSSLGVEITRAYN